jgi:hypothetical protein
MNNKSVFIVALILFIVIVNLSCGKDIYDENGIRVYYKENIIPPHGATTKLFFEGKEICSKLALISNSKPFMLSPNKQFILFIEIAKHGQRLSLYDTIKDKKNEYQATDFDFIIKFASNVKWYSDKVIVIGMFEKYILYFNDDILEMSLLGGYSQDSNEMKKERFFEYLMTLVKQSHQHVDKSIQYFFYENLPEILKKMRFDNDYEQFYYIERNKLDSLLPEIGKYLRKLIKNVEHSGCTNLSFKILQKVYQNSFEENNGQMKLKKNYSW